MLDVDRNLVVNNANGGSGSAYTGIVQALDTFGDDQNFSADFSADLTAIAQFTGSMESLMLYAVAETRFRYVRHAIPGLRACAVFGTRQLLRCLCEAFIPSRSCFRTPVLFFESGSISNT